MNNRKSIVITGGAGFVGSNLIKLLLVKSKFNILSIDNYSSGSKKNHIKSMRVKYIDGETRNIKTLIKQPKKIHSVFHFGEFARIYQSFINMNECFYCLDCQSLYYDNHRCPPLVIKRKKLESLQTKNIKLEERLI